MARSVFVFSDGWLQTGNYLHNPLQPLNSFGLKKSELKQGLHRNSTSWSVWRTERSIGNSAYRSQFRQKQKRSRSPAGPRRLGTATRMSASLSRRLSAFFESASGQGPKAAKFAALPPGHAGFPKRAERSDGSDTTPVRNAPVSACEPLCAILLRKPSVYPLSLVKANVGRLCEKLKIGIRSGLEQHCGGNFLAIFAGTLLDEKPNFTVRFFGWRRPFDFSPR